MSGIAGVLSRNSDIDLKDVVRKMCSLQSHRGPDGEGIVLDEQLMAIYQEALRTVPANGAGPNRRAALMTAGFCHEDKRVVAERGTELVGWYIEQQR